MTDGLLAIGAFSRASLVSAKQLRAYHEAGLLVPVEVDPQTGYRRYSVDQLTDAAIIVRLRALDLPLKAVREVREARDPERTRAILDAHQRVMQERLAEVERIVAALRDEPAAHANTPVHLREVRTRTVGKGTIALSQGRWALRRRRPNCRDAVWFRCVDGMTNGSALRCTS